MRLPIAGEGFELILTQDECAFEAVLDTLEDASEFTLVTFSIDSRRTRLIERLSQLRSEQPELDVFIGIGYPRFNNLPAETWVGMRRSLLGVEQLPDGWVVCISPVNHAKVIATDTLMYVGSQNFADVSTGNIEAGVLISDQDTISRFTQAIRNSVRETGTLQRNREESQFANRVLAAALEIRNSSEQILQLLTSAATAGDCFGDLLGLREDIGELLDQIEREKEGIRRLGEEAANNARFEDIVLRLGNLPDLLSTWDREGDLFVELFGLDEIETITRFREDADDPGDEDRLEEHLQSARDAASSYLSERFDDASEDMLELQEVLSRFIEESAEVSSLISRRIPPS